MENKNNVTKKICICKKTQIAIIVVSSLLIAIVITLSALLGVSMSKNGKWLKNAENSFQRAIYDLSESVFSIETDLSKMQVARSATLQREILLKAATDSKEAVASLTHLSYSGYDMSNLTKFINQSGDYCTQMLKKVNRGQALAETDYKSMSEMHQSYKNLSYQIAQIRERVASGDGKYVAQLNKLSNAFSSGITEIMNSAEYPSLIYDGAFSDSLTNKAPKCLPEGEITVEQGSDIAKEFLSDYNIASIKFVTENKTNIESFLYSFTTDSKLDGTIQITKKGGLPLMWDIFEEVTDPKFSEQEALELAKQYCAKNKLTATTDVWTSIVGSVLYVNLCCKEGDTTIYPDMIKLKVSLETGRVIGFEGLNYIYNHCTRSISAPVITLSQIQAMNFGNLQVTSTKLCLIPIEDGTETLAYEVFGTINDTQFFVYVDAINGTEIKVLQVIDSDEGRLTI